MTIKKISILHLIIRTAELTIKSFRAKKVMLTYCLILALMHILFSQWSYTCFSEINKEPWCYATHLSGMSGILYYGLFALMQYCLLVSFSYDLYQSAIKGTDFSYKNIIKPEKPKLKYLGLVTFSLIMFVVPILLGIKIFIKAPNPDWRIEMIYFVILFMLCWIPVIIIRMLSVLSYYMESGKLPKLKAIWQQTDNGGLAFLFVFGVLCFILNIINMNFRAIFITIIDRNNTFIVSTLCEFCGTIITLFYISCMTMFLRASQDIIDAVSNNNSEDNSEAENQDIADNSAPETAEKLADNKKAKADNKTKKAKSLPKKSKKKSVNKSKSDKSGAKKRKTTKEDKS